MHLFDEQGNVVEVNIEDITCVKRDPVNRRSLYYNGQWFYEANTINELAKIYECKGFHKIDKNKLINLNYVTEFKDGILRVNGTEYLVSRRSIPNIEKYMGDFTD